MKQISWKIKSQSLPLLLRPDAYIIVGLLYMASFVEIIKHCSEIPVTSNILQGNAYLYIYDSIALINAVSATT